MSESKARGKRLERAVEYARERYYRRGGWLTLEYKRKLEALLRQHRHAVREHGFLHWTRDGWRQTPQEILREALRQNLRIGALDAEFFIAGAGKPQLYELGVSYVENRNIVSRHFIIDPRPDVRSRTGAKFKHGRSKQVTRTQAREELDLLLERIDVLLFWHADGDRKACRAVLDYTLPRHKSLDLVRSSVRTCPTSGGEVTLRLSQYCEENGVQLRGMHCAGNDARGLLLAAMNSLGVRLGARR